MLVAIAVLNVHRFAGRSEFPGLGILDNHDHAIPGSFHAAAKPGRQMTRSSQSKAGPTVSQVLRAKRLGPHPPARRYRRQGTSRPFPPLHIFFGSAHPSLQLLERRAGSVGDRGADAPRISRGGSREAHRRQRRRHRDRCRLSGHDRDRCGRVLDPRQAARARSSAPPGGAAGATRPGRCGRTACRRAPIRREARGFDSPGSLGKDATSQAGRTHDR